jgi:hypothetical protein
VDTIAPADLSREYADAARRAGDAVTLQVVDGAGHFELVRPGSVAWPTVLTAIRALLGEPDHDGSSGTQYSMSDIRPSRVGKFVLCPPN